MSAAVRQNAREHAGAGDPPVRILQLVRSIATDGYAGGAERYGVRLARAFARRGQPAALAALWEYGTPEEQRWVGVLREEGVEVALLARPSGSLRRDSAPALRALWRLVADFEPQVIHSHSEQADVFNGAMRLAHPRRPLAVRTMHTAIQWRNRPWLGRVLLPWVFPLTFHAEVAISEEVRQALDQRPLARWARHKAVLSRAGVEEALFEAGRGEGLRPPGLPPGRPRLITVGRLTEQKGLAHLLAALREVRASRPAELLLVGAGPLEAELRAQAEALGLSGCVHFLGSRSDVPALLAHADVFVLASLWEGFPAVILEAMAARVPVVATDIPGSRDLVQDRRTGLLAPPGEAAGLARTIGWLLDHPEAAEAMAREAHAAARQFTIEAVARDHLALYRKAIRA